jgi:ectoine hydroxylase-related dioxygenase (phytanoyl-CoA dioxygenase family)
MRNVRTEPLSPAEVESFDREGYLFVGPLLDEATVDRLRDELAHITLGNSPGETVSYDLATREAAPKQARIPYFFNLWKTQPGFRAVAFSPVAARWAGQLLHSDRVRLLGDNAIVKAAHASNRLHLHQDFQSWPIATPDALTLWIALDDVTAANGAMTFVTGSHLRGERAPIDFSSGGVITRFDNGTSTQAGLTVKQLSREALPPIGDPEAEGMPSVTFDLRPGECTFHHCLTWHGSPPNTTDRARRAFTSRYVRDGTMFLGERRARFYYSDAEAGTPVGEPIGGRNFPPVDGPAPEAAAP